MTRSPTPGRRSTSERRSLSECVAASQPVVARAGIVAIALVLLVIAWFFVARPIGTWLDTRGEAAALEATLDQVEASNRQLEARRDALFTAEEIERLARRDYNLVLPFEEAYAVLPPPARDASWYHRWPY